MAELFKRHDIYMQKDKEDGGETESLSGDRIRVCGHYIRGHVESVCFRLANDPTITVAFQANAMIANAGHEEDTFHARYSRPMVPRQTASFKKHRNSSKLSKEEAQLT